MGLFGLFNKEKKETLDKGLEKTKQSVFEKLARAVAGKAKVDDDVLDNLEEILVTSDVGVDTTLKIIERIEERVAKDKYVSTSELNEILRQEIANLLAENGNEDNENWDLPTDHRPYVILVVGVNGVGKTTTIGKLAWQFKQAGKKVYLGGCCRRTAVHLGRTRRSACNKTADGQRPGECCFRHPQFGKGKRCRRRSH